MTARLLHLTHEVREAVFDARALRAKLALEGHEWAPALANANARVVSLARGEDGSAAQAVILRTNSEAEQ